MTTTPSYRPRSIRHRIAYRFGHHYIRRHRVRAIVYGFIVAQHGHRRDMVSAVIAYTGRTS